MNLHGQAISFPFRTDQRGGFVATETRHDLIAEAIADVIETRRGERVMLPDYGIPDFVFDVVDFSFSARLAYHIEEQVRSYVPLVRDVRVTSGVDDAGRAVANVRYTESSDVNAPGNLVYPIWRLIDAAA